MATLSCKPAGTKGRPWFLALLFALAAVGANAQIDTTPYRLDFSPGTYVKRFQRFPSSEGDYSRVASATNRLGQALIAHTELDGVGVGDVGFSRVDASGNAYFAGHIDSDGYSFSATGNIVLPASVTIGQTYRSSATWTGFTTGPFTETCQGSVRIVGFETVTVPAGTFTALKIVQTEVWSYGPLTETDTFWLVSGLGLVKAGSVNSDREELKHYVVLNAQPQAQTVAAGARATLSVTATGGGSSLTYQWRKDGVNVSGANASSYTLPSAQASHAGNYTVVVRNTAGSVTSSAATLTVKAPVTGVMTVRTIGDVGFDYGQGTVNPNYNGQLLEIGRHYTMTAVARPGSAFVNWTDGLDNVLTNAPTVKFEMVSNLVYQANFRDVTKPTFTVAAPTLNQRVSNAVFTATGTARDNVGVTAVNYQLNSGAWTAAGSTNSGTNWTAQLVLDPGPNTLRVFARDVNGRYSKTNGMSITYVVSAKFDVTVTGPGKLTPPTLSGQMLEVGKSYTVTATPNAGSKFDRWSGGTNTPSAKLVFTMPRGGLTVTATFSDATAPVVKIVSPKPNEKIRPGEVTATGTATDNGALSRVYYLLDANTVPGTATGTANWSIALPFLPLGNHTLKVYALDTQGNYSKTNTVTFSLPTYQGIYLGTYRSTAGPADSGLLALFVGADNSAIFFVGKEKFDGDNTFVQTIDIAPDGSFSLHEGDTYATAKISGAAISGTYRGTNENHQVEGGTFSLTRKADTGAKAAAAGYYEGEYEIRSTATGPAIERGRVRAVLAADGQFQFTARSMILPDSDENGDNRSGVAGKGTVSAANVFTAKADYSPITGTFTPANNTINGSFATEDGPGTLHISRVFTTADIQLMIAPDIDFLTNVGLVGILPANGAGSEASRRHGLELVIADVGDTQPLNSNVYVPPASNLAVQSLDHEFVLSFTAIPGRNYTIEVSRDLTTWESLKTVTAPAAEVSVSDPVLPDAGARFYRVISR